MKNILITGGCGFIGSNFIRVALNDLRHCNLINLDKLTYAGNPDNLNGIGSLPQYTFIKGDICDQVLVERIFAEHKIDTVIHFAAESHVERSISGPADFIYTNIVGTFNLLESARHSWLIKSTSPISNFKFLHVSTDEVYGSLGATGYFTEDTAYDPHSPYSSSKAAADHLVNAYFHTYGLPTLTTNCSNNYGAYQFPEKLIPLIITRVLRGDSLDVHGDGQNVRDWLYVEDHCRAILMVLHKGIIGESYNIGGNTERKNIEIFNLVCDLLDERLGFPASGKPRRSLIRYVKDRPGNDRRYAIDASKIKKQTGWEPQTTFEEGIVKTVDWYLENPEWVANILNGNYNK